MNPLLDLDGLPAFDAIAPEHIQPGMDTLLEQAQQALNRVTETHFEANWHSLALNLDVHTERMSRAWGAINHLNSVADQPALRAAYNEALPKVTQFWTQLGSDERLYQRYKSLSPDTLNTEQQRARHNALKGFVLGGAELEGDAKNRFAAIQERLAELSQAFSEHALDATDQFSHLVDAADLAGVPQDVIDAAQALAQSNGHPGKCQLTLKMPFYLPVMQFAQSSKVREALYRAYVTRASDQADSALHHLDNAPLMAEILALRQEEAQLLGFGSYAELSLATKMADSPEQVTQFLRDLAQKARRFAEQDIADMRQFAQTTLGLSDPQPWDWTYIGERLREARYAYSEQEVRQYFPLPKVLAGLFDIIEQLYEVTIQADQAPVWHPDVQFYRLERQGALVGQFYLDLSARTGKRGGAWMDDVRGRWLRPDGKGLQTPVAHLVCNFASATATQPALLTHDDVITLFHEFGHGLHHLLTQVNERDVAGISGVEWDAVELPSQFMENFCWEWPVLQQLTAHAETGEPLPRALYDKMVSAKNFQTGLQTLRQVEFALFDMLLHSADFSEPLKQKGASAIQDLISTVRKEVAVLQPPSYNRMPNTFSHVFSGGYSAGYYSYKWAEVLSADAYAAFEEAAEELGAGTSTLETPMGLRFRQTILEVGGSRPAMDSFKAFRGRAPSIDALLRHQGMSPTPQ